MIELIKPNDDDALAATEVVASREEILRVVFAIALDTTEAARCAGWSQDAPVTRWPSTLYRVLASAALHSPLVWRRCARVVDHALGDLMIAYRHHSPVELAEAFVEGRESMSGDELAALLWCLVRKRSQSCDLVAGRLGVELEVVAARRLHSVPPPPPTAATGQ
ncbi:MAG: hypothetical protein AAF500_20630 [Myxococcota bacterium]